MIKHIHFHLKKLERTKAPLMSRIAYRNGTKIECERTGLVFDYRKKKGVLNPVQRVYLPGGKSEDRIEFWSRADLHDRHPASVTAREAVADLPHILNDEQRFEICERFAKAVTEKYGVAVDFSLHAPHVVTEYMLKKDPQQFHIIDPFRDNEKNNGNYHVHILVSTSTVDAETGGFGNKNRDLDAIACQRAKKENSATWARPVWAQIVNEVLEKAGFDDRVEHESFEKLGLDQLATEHAGPAAVNRRREGKDSTKLDAIRDRAIAAAEEKIRLAEEYARLQKDIESTQDQLDQLQALLEKQQADPLDILENWSPKKKIADAVLDLAKRKQRQEEWFDYTKYSVTENLTILSILMHKLLVWLGFGGMPDVVNAMLKLEDVQDKIESTQQQYQQKSVQLDKMQTTALASIKKNQEKAQIGLQIKLKKATTLSEKKLEKLHQIGELMNATEQLLASLQQSIADISTAPDTPITQQTAAAEKKKNKKREAAIDEDDENGKTGKSGKAGGMQSMSPRAIKSRIRQLQGLRPDRLFMKKMESDGPFSLHEERLNTTHSVNELSAEVSELQSKLGELTKTSTLIEKLLRPIFDRTEEKEVAGQLEMRQQELTSTRAELTKIEAQYNKIWTQFKAENGPRWTQEIEPELNALLEELPRAESREAAALEAQAQQKEQQEQAKRDAYLQQQQNAKSVSAGRPKSDHPRAGETVSPAQDHHPRPKF
ncbi:MobA/MobL family protein [Pollutimonas sp. H1-120]|uniref:MobA/MobL family protein n=1 Tax=Pollutimonas sp. H1-120 TaxID=3148824 RepID=UPI003B51D520